MFEALAVLLARRTVINTAYRFVDAANHAASERG
jgi:hypothetical protein